MLAAARLADGDAAGLLGRAAATLERLVAAAGRPTSARPEIDALGWRSAVDARTGDGDADRLDTALAGAEQALRDVPGDQVVTSPQGAVRLTDLVRVGLLELTVQGLDLGVQPDRQALRLTARLLVDLLSARQPGRSVELRVPPHAAAQVVAGTTHTRGTPPAVVEVDPVAWLELATGRRTWAEAVADGSLRARGGRSDLSPHLPLLR